MPKRRHDDEDAFDERGVLKDGRGVRVSMLAMDGLSPLQRAVAADAAVKKYGLYPAGSGAKEGGACTIDGRRGRLVKVEGGGFVCVPVDGKEDSMPIDTDAPTVVVDGFGDSGLAAMSRPGPRYLHSGHKTVDHAVQLARECNVRDAHAESVADMSNAWRGNVSDREVARVHDSGDPLRDAYLDQLADLTSAWSGGTRSVR
jgi:hypothetical protein